MTNYLQRLRRRWRGTPDAGMTLPEVLVSMVIMGTLLTAMVGATTAILRQQDNSSGRLNNARSEQNVGVWLPSDLASAEDVSTAPGDSPCGTQCPAGINVGGSNALMLTWTGSIPGDTESIPTRTTVSYRYVQVGTEWQIIRVACVSVNSAPPSCDQVVVLHNVTAPPIGINFTPGITSPTWVMVVRLALDPTSTDNNTEDTAPADPTYYTKNGRRVTVTINGGGDAAGAGGGQDQITLSAGGTDRKDDLSTSNFSDPPSFSATRSRCGGNFGMIVDTSGSIGSTNMASVRTGITAFINSFAGTPIKLQIVRFSSNAMTLGAGSGWSRYYDMLVDNDVNDLKLQVATLSSTGSTNWEDGLFRMFKNSDGTVQSILPDTLIFFTDGIPNYSRLNSTTATAPAVADPDDSGLPNPGGNNFAQVAWNRADRIARDYYADVDRFIGVYVGSDTAASSTWYTQGAGYHYENFIRGYHNTWDRGHHLENFQRGYHTGWEAATTGMTYQYAGSGLTYQYAGTGLTYEYAGSGLTYQYASSGLTYQYASSGLTYQYATTGVVYEKKTGTWNTTPVATYLSSNTTPDETDKYRARVTGTPGGWTTMTKAQYDKSNSAVGGTTDAFQVTASSPSGWTNTTKALYDLSNMSPGTADGFQVLASSPSGWTNTTKAIYDASNSGPDSTDGFKVVTGTLGTWTATTKAYFDLNNALAGSTDGYRVTATGALGTWTTMTKALYDLSNTLPNSTDGFRTVVGSLGSWTTTTQAYYDVNNSLAGSADGYQVIASSPGGWTTTTQAYYDLNNTTANDGNDGFRTTSVYSTPYSLWETTTEALYTSNNTTADNTDGWTADTAYTAPFTTWVSTTQALYDGGNTTADETDGWRVNYLYSSPYTGWESTTEAQYTANNTATGNSDGWDATKVYTQPYLFHESFTTSTKKNTEILSLLVSEGAPVPAVPTGGPYTNAAVADQYILPNWNQFAGALNAMALAECGGTVTVQTKVAGAPAADPFTYQNSADLTIATTSSQYRSGTFDFDLSGGHNVTADITPLNLSGLTKYAPVSWACKSAGADYPFTTTAIPDSPWSKITLTVSPNTAISCVQTVRLV